MNTMPEQACPPPRRSSQQWWQEVRSDPLALRRWLISQYRGEVTAAVRIEQLRDTHAPTGSRAARVLTRIASDERRHAKWVGELLASRGEAVRVDPAPPRYWVAPLRGIHDLETGCAVGAHAEAMRLERIEVICADEAAPADIREVFRRILPEERVHAAAFTRLTNVEALEATRDAHEQGRSALGLVP